MDFINPLGNGKIRQIAMPRKVILVYITIVALQFDKFFQKLLRVKIG